MRVWLSFARTLAGTASAVVPFAIGVHLLSEALAIGPGAISADFWLRHAYLLAPLALAVWSFSRTVGIGAQHSEMIRRCALLRARLRNAGAGSSILAFTVTNVLFFAATQLLEGVPIASASIGTGLGVAALGALLSALVIFFWGRSLVATALVAGFRRSRAPRPLQHTRRRFVEVSRAASAAFSLFVPNRPPPAASPA